VDNRKKMKVRIFIFLIIIGGVVFAFLYLPGMQNRSEVYRYLPQLKNHDLRNVKVEKIYADPSYLVPYSVLVSFESDAQSIIQELGLKNMETVDTSVLKSTSWVEEYDLYFSMYSINAVRYVSIKKQIEDIKWWQMQQCYKNYASPYLDSNNKKSTVLFGKKNNGRVVCCKKEKTYFLLIECWG